MEIHHGSHRLVVAFPHYGIAIKIAKIRPWSAIKSLASNFNGYLKGYYKLSGLITLWWLQLFGFKSEGLHTAKSALFMGILDNWREFFYYRRTRNPFLQPTWISLFGFINIQRYGRPCDEACGDLYKSMYYLSERMIATDGHHFNDNRNFTLVSGHLRILDYGGRNTQQIISRYGRKIWSEFDLKSGIDPKMADESH